MAALFDPEVDILVDGSWVSAIDVGGGVRQAQPITINTGRANWSSRTETGRCGFTLDNRDGRWSPDYASGAYAGLLKRNLPVRVGLHEDDVHLGAVPGSGNRVSTPDVAGTGGGSPTTPVVESVTESSETSFTTTHSFDMPATISADDRLLLFANLGHVSATASSDLDDWTQVVSASMFEYSGVRIYEIYCTSALATSLAGGTVDFTTSVGVKSSCQVFRVSGCRSGGQGAAWAVSAGAGYAFTTTPNPDSLTAPWGADENLFIALVAANGDGAAVTANPSGYTAGADGDTNAGYVVASAYKASSSATDDPGTFTLDDTENTLAWTFVYRPEEDTSADGVLDITGDIDIRIELQLTEDLVDIFEGAQDTPMAYKTSGNNGWTWVIFRFVDELHSSFEWYDSSGTWRQYSTLNTSATLPWTVNYDRIALRFTLDVNNGSSDSDGTWYWSDSIDGTWTTIATDTGEGTTSIKSNDAPLLVGGNDFVGFETYSVAGKVYAFELRDGIGGTEVANPDFTAQTVGASSFADAAGRTWTIGDGGELTDMRWRFHGELASLPVRWNLHGGDVTAPVEAAGLFRRLRQGDRRVTSALRRAIQETTGVVAYWPIEEVGDQVARFGADIGDAPMTVTAGGFPEAGSIDAFLSSEPIADPAGTQWTAYPDAYTSVFNEWQIRWLQSVPSGFSLPTVARSILEVLTSDMKWRVMFREGSSGSMKVLADRGATNVYDSGWFAFAAIGKDLRMSLGVTQNGSNVDVELVGQQADEASASGFATTAAVGGNAGVVTRIRINAVGDFDGIGIGHVTLGDVVKGSGSLADPLNAYDGELAAIRIARLCAEAGIAVRIEGDPGETEIMGPQRAGTLIELLEECADTDLGILHESRQSTAVGYRTRASMLDQSAVIALDYSDGEVAGSPELDRDDQNFRNDVTVVNASGSTARAVLDDGSDLSISAPPTGAGQYDTQFDVNGQDSRLQDLADTRLALTSVDEPRVSSLKIAMESTALQADATLRAAILESSLGDLLTVDNNLTVALGSTQLRQLVQGVQETISPYRHHLDLLTSPASPWESGGGVVDPPDAHTVTYRSQNTLATAGQPDHVLTALGYTGTYPITRADLDDILDDWVAATGGTLHECDNLTEWNTALGAALPGDLIRATTTFDPADGTNVRGDLYGISGATLTSSTDGGSPGLPIIVTCADGVYLDPNNTASDDGVVDLQNCRHVWAVGLNVRDGQFGIRAWNWGGTEGFPAYIAYCSVENMGHSGINAQGWFELIADSGGTPPAGTGNTYGFSEWFVIEENDIDGVGTTSGQFGEAIYIGKGSPGYFGYAHDAWIRGNRGTDWTSDGVDVKPGCYRVFVLDNDIYVGHAVLGAPLSILYIGAGIGARPSWWDFDPEIYVEGNRVHDNDLTNTDASSAEIMGYVGVSGIRIANNVFWAWPQGGTDPCWRARMEIGSNDTEAEDYYRTDPTWIINNTCWGDDAFDAAGYGVPLTAFPSAITAIFDVRNNIVDNASPATGEVDADSDDFIATVPAVGVAGDAEWETYGYGSAFDLALDSTLIGTGEDISDIALFIEQDVSQRDIDRSDPNPGAFQPHPANQ